MGDRKRSHETPPDPSIRQQIKSPYYWFSLLALATAISIWIITNTRWLHTVAAVLYVIGLLASMAARRHARAIGLRSGTTDENGRLRT